MGKSKKDAEKKNPPVKEPEKSEETEKKPEKSEKPEKPEKVEKPKSEPKKVQKTRTDFGGIFLLLLLNGVAYWALIQHFSEAIGMIKEDADDLEKGTQF